MKKSVWFVHSICLLSMMTTSAIAGEKKTGERQQVPPKSVSDNRDKKVTDPTYSQRIQTPPKNDPREVVDCDWCPKERK